MRIEVLILVKNHPPFSNFYQYVCYQSTYLWLIVPWFFEVGNNSAALLCIGQGLNVNALRLPIRFYENIL